jgi:hypothetical protein
VVSECEERSALPTEKKMSALSLRLEIATKRRKKDKGEEGNEGKKKTLKYG